MEKVTLFLTALALASPAFGQSAPTQPNSAEAVRAEVAEIMAATEVRAAAPLVPAPGALDPIEDDVPKSGVGLQAQLKLTADPSDLAMMRAGRSLTFKRMNLPDFESYEPRYSLMPLNTNPIADSHRLSFSREGLGWSMGNTRLSVHAAYLHGATGDPNSAAPLPVAVDGLDLAPAANAHRQFVFTLQAEIVF